MALFDGAATPWRADPAALTPAIQAIWAEVEVDASRRSEACSFRWTVETEEGPVEAYLHEDASRRSEACSFRWTVETEEGPVEAYLHEDGTCLYLDTSLTDAARLACLFRRFVPRDVELVLCDQGYNFDIPLRHDIDDAELIEQMNAVG
ncbi:hypothetical protein [Streptomyces sp. NPDC088762]|uniref:hypothetical protein n=1 Tax=Streptomyces sp. NPDC088762 TaxID=3365891 RepID=UPI0037FE97C8